MGNRSKRNRRSRRRPEPRPWNEWPVVKFAGNLVGGFIAQLVREYFKHRG